MINALLNMQDGKHNPMTKYCYLSFSLFQSIRGVYSSPFELILNRLDLYNTFKNFQIYWP